jgi:hypothetical protein
MHCPSHVQCTALVVGSGGQPWRRSARLRARAECELPARAAPLRLPCPLITPPAPALAPLPPQAASAQGATAPAAGDKRDKDPFFGKCTARKWGQSKKIPLSKNTDFCCAHWSFDKRKSQ